MKSFAPFTITHNEQDGRDEADAHPVSAVTGLQSELDAKEPTITAGTTSQYYRGDKSFQTLDKAAVGLGNVDNTSDLNKPISTATQTALDGKKDTFTENTAFNKNFGTTSGTVAEGNDSRIVNALQNDGTSDSYIAGVAQAPVDGLAAALTTFGGVSGGNPALTVQVVMKTTEGKAQIVSLEDGNEIVFYLNGADFAAGTVKTRVFLAKGEIYIESGVVDGSIITSTKGIMGASGNAAGANESPMPLGVQGFQGTQFFLFAFRNSNAPTGNNRGEVYVVCGAVPCEVELLNGSGTVVVDSASLSPFEHTILLTNANSEFQVVATNPVFVGIASRMGVPGFCDMRLVPPLATEVIGQNQNARVSALYSNTEVWFYRQNGNIGKFTVSPGSPVNIQTGTINELGNVWRIKANTTPATGGTFTITVDGETTAAIAYNANAKVINDALVALPSRSQTDFLVELVYGDNLGSADGAIIVYNMGTLARINITTSIDTTGLTGNAHVYANLQNGTAASNAGVTADYGKDGLVRLISSGPISAFSGADGVGVEATYYVPTNALTQRVGIPLAIQASGTGADNCLAVHSLYNCNVKVYDSSGVLINSAALVKTYGAPVDKYQQRFPAAINFGLGGQAGIDVDLNGGVDYEGGYIEVDTPAGVVINTRSNETINPSGITTESDEMVCFGITPDPIRAEIREATDGLLRKRVIDSTGTETWELV